jgi:hypothetical protein
MPWCLMLLCCFLNTCKGEVTGISFVDSTPNKKNMKQKLVKLIDKILLRKRALSETVNEQLKNIFPIEHSRHRSSWNFLVNLMSGLIAYSYMPHKPSLDLDPKALSALPPAVF